MVTSHQHKTKLSGLNVKEGRSQQPKKMRQRLMVRRTARIEAENLGALFHPWMWCGDHRETSKVSAVKGVRTWTWRMTIQLNWGTALSTRTCLSWNRLPSGLKTREHCRFPRIWNVYTFKRLHGGTWKRNWEPFQNKQEGWGERQILWMTFYLNFNLGQW